MLITSREQRRWVVPKGNPIGGLNLHEAAAHEAFEEAGVSGIPCPTALGEYHYLKRRRDGTTRNVTVAVFPLAYQRQADEWPEQDERETKWFDLVGASDAVDEPELKQLIRNFRVPAITPGFAERVLPTSQTTNSRERKPMMRWFQRLMPQQGRFFELFEAHAETLVAGADALAETSAPVLDWISEQRIQHVAIHFDLDVLDPLVFRPLNFNEPGLPPDAYAGVARGRMLPDQVVRLLNDVGRACDVVGLAITEHLPWDTLAMRDMLRQLPLMRG